MPARGAIAYAGPVADLGWIEAMIERPPGCLSELERCVGTLDVDFRGSEGRGAVLRPSPEQPWLQLRAGISQLMAGFYFDEHLEDPRRPRDMKLRSFSLRLEVSHASVARRLEQRFGPGRAIEGHGGTRTEYGEWFYLKAGHDGSANLSWHHVRPGEVLPRDAPALLEDFLATLVDRLVCEVTEPPILAALGPVAAALGAELQSPLYRVPSGGRGIAIRFNAGLPVALVAAAFRWEVPVASLGDHRTASAVGPLAAALDPPWAPVLGSWWIDARLQRSVWPHGPDGARLPLIERGGGLSPVHDMRTSQDTIAMLAALPVETIERPQE